MEPKILNLIDEVNNSAPAVKDIQSLIKNALIPQGVDIPKPDLVFAINGIPVFTKKSISTLIGKAKAGKTTVTSWIVAKSIKEGLKALWIDTEQGQYYGSRTQSWVLHIAGYKTSENLCFYDLKIHTPQDRIEMIEEIIKELNPDLVIIDGVRDLVYDINSPEEATTKTGSLMRWAEEYNTHIAVVLHQNKGNEHARGHLGTEMINKSETVIKIEQNEEKLIVCTPEYTRSKAFDVFAFNRDEHGIPFIVDGFAGAIATQCGEGKKKKLNPWDASYDAMYPELVDFVFQHKEHVTMGSLKDSIKSYMMKNGVEIGEPKAREFKDRLLEIGIIWENPYIKQREGNVGKNPKYVPKPKFIESPKIDNLYNNKPIIPKPDDEDPPF